MSFKIKTNLNSYLDSFLSLMKIGIYEFVLLLFVEYQIKDIFFYKIENELVNTKVKFKIEVETLRE